MSEPFAAIERILDVAPHYAGIAEDEFKAARAELEAARKLLRTAEPAAEDLDRLKVAFGYNLQASVQPPDIHAFTEFWEALKACRKPASGRQE